MARFPVPPTKNRDSLLELLKQGSKPTLSFEFFPPKNPEGLEKTKNLIKEIAEEFHPDFVNITYGAGGGARELSRQMVRYCCEELQLQTIAHLTCRDHSIGEIEEVINDFGRSGAAGILALRGDPPKGSTNFEHHPEGFATSYDLVGHIAKMNRFIVAIAGYPEKHRDAPTLAADLAYLKEKIDVGAELVITQLFFDNNHYFKFVEDVRRLGIATPILPGIMPIANLAQVKKFVGMCGATIPTELLSTLESFRDDEAEVARYGTEYSIAQCKELLANGAPGIHFYTLNKAGQVRDICEQLAIKSS